MGVSEYLQSLVVTTKAGNVESFGQIYDLLVDRIYRFFYFRVGIKEEAEDLTEQIFLKVYTKINNYQNNGIPFEAWMFKIARNQLIDYYRTKKTLVSLDKVEQVTSKDNDPEAAAENELTKEAIFNALKNLPHTYQEMIILKFIEEKDNKEISKILNKPVSHIRVLQNRSLKALRKVLKI